MEQVDELVVLDPGEIGAGAEVAAGAGQHEHPASRAVVGRGQPGEELLERLVVERVAPLGTIDRDAA